MEFSRSLLQTNIWAKFKSRHGWTDHQIRGSHFLERALPLGQRLLYAPELTLNKNTNFAELITQAHALAQQQRAFLVRFEFLAEYHPELADQMAQYGLVKAFEEVQPEFRHWLNLAPSVNQILVAMKPKGRYNIRLAQRHGVKVATSQDSRLFYTLATTTAQRDGFQLRSQAYYADLIETLVQEKVGELLVATQAGTPLAAAIISYYDGLASYLYGASASGQRELMAPYLLHWTAIQHAKKHHCHTYDLLAIAPPEATQLQTSNFQLLRKKYAGLTRFKQQFGGGSVHLLGSWDLPVQPLIYTVFRLAEIYRRR